MTSDELIDQLEFRWVPQLGYSLIAGSANGDHESTKLWSQRLHGLARHPDTPATTSPGVPDTSLVYVRFDRDRAAILWRAWRRDAIDLGDTAERRPFVCRAFVGPAKTLRLTTALATCRMGLPVAATALPPGEVRPQERLRALAPEIFHELRNEADAVLGDRARAEQGLSLLIAAVLRNPGGPLSVILPERETYLALGEAPQAGLLWGLGRVAAPLLKGLPEARYGSWSFSTYEPPHDDTQTSDLPHVVFRHKHLRWNDVAPHVIREEAVVRPRAGCLSRRGLPRHGDRSHAGGHGHRRSPRRPPRPAGRSQGPAG
jgi:hypothetical protein